MSAQRPTHDAVEPLAELTDRLRRTARRITAPRQTILDILHRRRQPLSTKEIFLAMPGDACNLATVYRSLRLLEDAGIVQRLDFGDGAARYELIGEGNDGHHHHLICKRCARVVELGECLGVGPESHIAAASGFKDVTHRLEFFGVCPRCQ